MNNIIITMGCNASGKSTWAREQAKRNPKTVRFCRDDARAMLNGGEPWGHYKLPKDVFNLIENNVSRMRDAFIVDALKNGLDVILDETNAKSRTFNDVVKLLKKHNFATIVYEKPFYVDLETALARDAARTPRVGADIVKKYWSVFGEQAFSHYKGKSQTFYQLPILRDSGRVWPQAIICDLDGTLCLFGDNNPYNRDFTKDEPNLKVLQLLQRHSHTHEIIFVSGRLGDFYGQTKEWLTKYGLGDKMLLMRDVKDLRNDAQVKFEIYRDNIYGKFNVDFVLDDRNRVVQMWRNQGLTCLQVAEGDF